METSVVTEFEDSLANQTCVSVTRQGTGWLLELSKGTSIALSVPWRIVSDGQIFFGDEDDGQIFGLPEPVNGEAVANDLLRGQSITKATTDPETGDLSLMFRDNLRLDAFNNSSGYEGWTAKYELDGKSYSVIAMGGGKIAVLTESSTLRSTLH